ncbi:SpvB/TcaC N-terminal domain-containing protein [Pseudomonas sp.]|uniref:SpvB/TcaC N-terminal domain-containing protein n=1 Tax=Pseudomonas sp. TaxID=306 RepID=UPI003F37A349
MSEDAALPVSPPALPKGGGAIQGIGDGLGAIGSSGTASCEIPLAVSPGRGYAPTLALRYSSAQGNGVFGMGWKLSLPLVSRRTQPGVPAYTRDDLFIGPDAEVLMPVRDRITGVIESSQKLCSDGTRLVEHTVVRYRPRIETAFNLIEHWSSATDEPGYWLIHNADGSQHLFGKTPSARRADPDALSHVGEWLLEESMNPHGEHIVYEYNADPPSLPDPADSRAQRYLDRIRYGNFQADAQLYLCKAGGLQDVRWHFEVCFDYGERSTALDEKPAYRSTKTSPARSDPFSDFSFGFELRTRRLCRQILMFHHFPDETSMGPEPVLVRRSVIEYQTSPHSYSCLSAAFDQAYSESTDELHPPLEFTYTDFALEPDVQRFKPFQALSELNHQQRFQFFDLLGEGLPGVLHRTDKSWRYSQPVRDDLGGDRVTYRALGDLPQFPLADSRKPTRQFLGNLSSDGRPNWVLAQPGLSGFFTLKPNGTWSNFAALDAVPTEFFHPQGQLANLMGAGLNDLVMLGPRSVRLYANQKGAGFATATEIDRGADEDDLPLPGNSSSELAAFSDLLGSGQQHLVRIRHNEVKCWPNLGRGRFGKGRVIATLDFSFEAFDASRLLLADLDGSGSADLIYLESHCARIFMNLCGNGLSPAIDVPWPAGFSYDRLCQVHATDLQGLGCSSLVLSAPGATPRHWRCDFVSTKPYLLQSTNNNMGASGNISYRSSAQEWLDEKKQALKHNKPAVPRLPFPLFLVKKQIRFDEITGNRLTQTFKYRRGFYDSTEREFRGFGQLVQTDNGGDKMSDPQTAPTLTKTWFHVGNEVDPLIQDRDNSDKKAVPLKETIHDVEESRRRRSDRHAPANSGSKARQREIARALNGRILRVEVYGQDQGDRAKLPYSVQQHRYKVNELKGKGRHSPYSILHPVLVESIHYQYERFAEDPRCTHTVNLGWDAYGYLTHYLEISYARRTTAVDTCPFTDVWEKKWWVDAHDEDQQFYYLTEHKAQFIHIDTAQHRRLGLPYLQRKNALKLPKLPLAEGLAPSAINHEALLILSASAAWKTRQVLSGLSLQRYRNPDASGPLTDGQASVEALLDHTETAELNELALSVYDVLKPRAPSFDLPRRLDLAGYRKMPIALPSDSEWDKQDKLWSVRRRFVTYKKLDGFFKPLSFKQSLQHGSTTFTHDRYDCLTTGIKLPDNCTTTASNIDYRILQSTRITDSNNVVQEASYDAFGQLHAISHYKSSADGTIGFAPLSTYIRRYHGRPDLAIENPDQALQQVASAYFYDAFSWMGRIALATQQDQAWCKVAIAKGDLLPGGHIRASTRARLARNGINKTPYEQALQTQIESVQREPVHCATLQADRYLNDVDSIKIRIGVECRDGFGRSLQSKQKVGPGPALAVNEDGTLNWVDDKPQEHSVDLRWRVSKRIEYNNKGLVTRTWRPYFSDRHRYVNDESLRKSGLCDQYFHDPMGRLIRVINAKGDERHHTWHPWYSIVEDENDTQPGPQAHGGAQ